MPLTRTKSYAVACCARCGRGETLVVKDTRSPRAALESRGWSEDNGEIICPECNKK